MPAQKPRRREWGSMIWVKVTHPLGQWAQEVRDENGTVCQESAYAVTDPQTGRQVPVPQLLTFTLELEKALKEWPLGSRRIVASIVECTDQEVEAFLGRATKDEERRKTAYSAGAEELAQHLQSSDQLAATVEDRIYRLRSIPGSWDLAMEGIELVHRLRARIGDATATARWVTAGEPQTNLPATADSPAGREDPAGREEYFARATRDRESRWVHGG